MIGIKYFISVIVALFLLSCSNNHHSVVIKGKISNLSDPQILVTCFSADTLVVDTIWSNQKGRFIYKSSIDTLTTFSFYFNNQSSSVIAFAYPDNKITIKGDALISDLIKVNGNDINNDLTTFKEMNVDLLERRALLFENYQKSLIHDDSLQTIRLLSENDGMAKINSINQELILRAEDFIEKNPSSMSSLVLINEFFANPENSKGFERMMEYMKADILKSKMGLNLKNYLNKINRSAEGSAMPFFQLKDIKGDTIRSYDLRGKYLLLSFVSTTGIDSREEIASLKKIYNNLRKDSVEFVSIYIDSDIYPVEYLKNDSIPWKVVAETKSWASDIVDSYNIEFVPFNILISPTGIISSRNISPVAVEKALRNSLINSQ